MTRIQISVPRVPWHCEHNVNKKECEICGRPDDANASGRDSTDDGRDSTTGPGSSGSTDSGSNGPGAYTHPGGDNAFWTDDPILSRAAFND